MEPHFNRKSSIGHPEIAHFLHKIRVSRGFARRQRGLLTNKGHGLQW